MLNNKRCPLCEKENNCQAENPSKSCWCRSVTFTKELNEKLSSLPGACICSTCAQKLGAKEKVW